MSFYFVGPVGGGATSLDRAVRAWTCRNPLWNQRACHPDSASDEPLSWLFSPYQQYRRSEAFEVAESLVADPEVVAALRALDSPPGQAIEKAVLSQFMPPADAELLTKALGAALQYVTDQSKPLWKRTDVLLGVGAAVAILVVVAIIARHGPSGSPGAA